MPKMNGYDATSILKEKQPEVPVIVVTAYATADDRKDLKQSTCDDFMTKPLDRKKLIHTLDHFLSKGN